MKRRADFSIAVMAVALLAACASSPPPPAPPSPTPAEARALIERSIPRNVADRAGWAADLYSGFTVQSIDVSRDNVCAVAAVIEQESGFRVNPVVPDLPAIAWREIDTRAARAGVPKLIVHGALQLKSPTGRTYGERIDGARTEKDLSDIFEDFIAAVPMGRTLFEEKNPIRTRGPMQVNVAFAEQYAAAVPYPYPIKASVADELFTRRGSLYFGIGHLLRYSAPYDQYLFRFADFNAGQYASRNAAFQNALGTASGISLIPDGALMPHGAGSKDPGSTELAARALARRLNLSESAIHSALEQGRSRDFERSALYLRTFSLAEQTAKEPLPRALVPQIELHSPKIRRHLTTDWYARRVDGRFRQCLRGTSAQP